MTDGVPLLVIVNGDPRVMVVKLQPNEPELLPDHRLAHAGACERVPCRLKRVAENQVIGELAVVDDDVGSGRRVHEARTCSWGEAYFSVPL